jgi:hypothetical protein
MRQITAAVPPDPHGSWHETWRPLAYCFTERRTSCYAARWRGRGHTFRPCAVEEANGLALSQESAAPWRIAALNGAALPCSGGLRSHPLFGLGMLLLACARREATHDLIFRERYLRLRTHLHERRCPRRVVHWTQSAYPIRLASARRWHHQHITTLPASNG